MKLFLWEKCAGDPAKTVGTILFVHGSSMASQPTFDLQVPGRTDSSVMVCRQGDDLSVITSYSIHYTKLYDSSTRCNTTTSCPWRCA